MAFWDSVVQTVTTVGRNAARLFVPGPVIANTYPDYEVMTPQYPNPSPYPLAVNGYRRNEVIYACIQKRAVALAEAPMQIYQKPPRGDKKATAKILEDHECRQLLERPNEAMSEGEFWRAVEIYMLIAGFSVWEMEFNNAGLPVNLWPMRPDWCSFRRGPNRPLQYVRYQPYGLPPQDVPIENCLVFMEFDPIYPMLKGLSKTAVAMRTATADNAATDFLASFFQRGAIISGVLKTEQSLQDAEAERIRQRWRKQHGGSDNWGDPAVLGSGTSYQPIAMNFKDMDFTNIDGRDEARLCSIYGVPTLLLGAKVGLTASTFSNFEQARKQFQEETVEPQRTYYASECTTQLVSKWDDTRKVYAGFDVTKVRALQEDQDKLHTRIRDDAKMNLITRDEAREAMGLEAIDNDQVFVGVIVRAKEASDIAVGGPGEQGLAVAQPVALTQDVQATQVAQAAQAQAQPAGEVKALTEWRKLAIEANRKGDMFLIDPHGSAVETKRAVGISIDLISCKSASDVRAVFTRYWPHDEPPKAKAEDATLEALVAEVRLAREALEAKQ